MINNLQDISNFFNFSPNEYCYNLLLTLRKKENHNVNKDIIIIPIKTKEDLIKEFNDLKEISDTINARMYFSAKKIYYSDFANNLKNRISNKNLSDQSIYDLYGNKNYEAVSRNGMILIDIDEEESFLVSDIQKFILDNKLNILCVPSQTGYHIIGNDQDIQIIIDNFNNKKNKLYRKLHLDCRLMLYSPSGKKH